MKQAEILERTGRWKGEPVFFRTRYLTRHETGIGICLTVIGVAALLEEVEWVLCDSRRSLSTCWFFNQWSLGYLFVRAKKSYSMRFGFRVLLPQNRVAHVDGHIVHVKLMGIPVRLLPRLGSESSTSSDRKSLGTALSRRGCRERLRV